MTTEDKQHMGQQLVSRKRHSAERAACTPRHAGTWAHLVVEGAEDKDGASPLPQRQRVHKDEARQQNRQKLASRHDRGKQKSPESARGTVGRWKSQGW